MKKKIVMMLLMCCIPVLLLGCEFMSRKNMNNKLASLERESEKIPTYVYYDTMYINGKCLDLKNLLKPGSKSYFEDVFLVKNGRIWFLYREIKEDERNMQIWNLASVTDDGTDMIVHYSGEFCASEYADSQYLYRDHRYKKEGFSTVSGYYYNEKIVLTDHDKLVEYNMTDKTVTEYKACEYEYPEVPLIADIQDYQKIYFTKDSETKVIDLEIAAENSEAFREIKELEQEKDRKGGSLLKYLFDNVQMVGDDIYITCRVLNYWGETYAVVFKYDFESNTCRYVFNYFTNDVIGAHLYIVPEMSFKKYIE